MNAPILHEDTNLIPWPNFFISAMRRRKSYGVIVVVACAAAVVALISFGYLIAAPATFLLIAVFAGILADAKFTRNVVVYLKDEDGTVYQDHQKWWTEDSMTWPDESKFDHKGKRVLWIDGTDPDKPVSFEPWLAPIPTAEIDTSTGATQIPVTGSRVASVKAKNKAISKIMKYTEPTAAANLRQGLLVGALIIGLIAILMAVNRAAEIMGFAT